jgi:hypothetical protein
LYLKIEIDYNLVLLHCFFSRNVARHCGMHVLPYRVHHVQALAAQAEARNQRVKGKIVVFKNTNNEDLKY